LRVLSNPDYVMIAIAIENADTVVRSGSVTTCLKERWVCAQIAVPRKHAFNVVRGIVVDLDLEKRCWVCDQIAVPSKSGKGRDCSFR
jgi:hypothetical protein